MTLRLSRTRLLLLLLVLAFYGFALYRNLNESERRSLRLQHDVPGAEKVLVTMRIVGVDLQKSELTARMMFRVAGTIADDEITPSVDLKLLLNSIRGSQEVELEAGKRLNPVEVIFPLTGDSNRYPFDVHRAAIAFMITKPGRAPASPPAMNPLQLGDSSVLVGPAELERRVPVPVALDLEAAIPGIKVAGELLDTSGGPQTEIRLKIRRADNLIVVSVIIMGTMLSLAFSLLAMVLYATQKGRDVILLPLSAAVSLIFGLPALRNAQPGVPPLGAFSDYLVFLWAELIVAGCTVIVIWTWIVRTHQRAMAKTSEVAAPKP